MTQARILCFLAVVKYQSFSAAASHLNISQPAISKQIALLEKALAFTLIDRTSSTIRLTEAGTLFYCFFQKSIEEFERTLREAKRLSSNQESA